ncbi:MAG: phytanoyl-CoA dioxygenase family protein [Crocinitomicaceae bacterium]
MKKTMSENIAFYREHGYLILKNFYTEKDCQAISEGYRKCIESKKDEIEIIYENDGTTPRSIMSYHLNEETLDFYTREARALEVVKEIVGPEFYVSQSKINPKAPVDESEIKGKKWDYHRGFAFWNLLDGMPRPDMVSSFIFLTEQNEQNGAVFVLEDSHKDVSVQDIKNEIGLIDDEGLDRTNDTSEYLSIQIQDEELENYKSQFKRVILEGEAGDLVFMDPKLLHASEPNLSNKSRDLMITVYNSSKNLPQTPRTETYLCERNFEPVKPAGVSAKAENS